MKRENKSGTKSQSANTETISFSLEADNRLLGLYGDERKKSHQIEEKVRNKNLNILDRLQEILLFNDTNQGETKAHRVPVSISGEESKPDVQRKDFNDLFQAWTALSHSVEDY